MKLIDIEENKIYTNGEMLFERVEDCIHEAKDLETLKHEDYYWTAVSSIKKLNSEVWKYDEIKSVCIDNHIYLYQKDMKINMTKKQFEEIYDKCIAPF
ncbi:hypothetical protein [Clostridium thermobutyricum]|uniref:hypothetical protein n=1 Tax=Clostridium thermobutyricum TaxID=29372 RepID=UPI003F523D82